MYTLTVNHVSGHNQESFLTVTLHTVVNNGWTWMWRHKKMGSSSLGNTKRMLKRLATKTRQQDGLLQFICLILYLFGPAQEAFERGVQLAQGFPLRGKWTYGEVFHPAVVPQPPFRLVQLDSLQLDFHNRLLSNTLLWFGASQPD